MPPNVPLICDDKGEPLIFIVSEPDQSNPENPDGRVMKHGHLWLRPGGSVLWTPIDTRFQSTVLPDDSVPTGGEGEFKLPGPLPSEQTAEAALAAELDRESEPTMMAEDLVVEEEETPLAPPPRRRQRKPTP